MNSKTLDVITITRDSLTVTLSKEKIIRTIKLSYDLHLSENTTAV